MGTFGLPQKNYRGSLRAGWKLIARLRDPELQAGATECSTCELQMEQGAEKPTIHPLKCCAELRSDAAGRTAFGAAVSREIIGR